jgi:hypothetical protein
VVLCLCLDCYAVGSKTQDAPEPPADSKKSKKKKKVDTTDIDALLAEIDGPKTAAQEAPLPSGGTAWF